MNRSLPLLLLLILLAGGCASTSQRHDGPPDWLTGQSSRYPASAYLTGVGSGATVDDARDRARADLAKAFEVAITERASDERIFTRTTENGTSHQKLDEQIFRRLVTRASRSIEGIEIADAYLDPETGRHHALAVLSKQRAAEQLHQKIAQLDQATAEQLRKAERAQAPLEKAAAIARAIQLQQQRRVEQASLRVVDASGRGSAPRWSLAKLQGQLEKALAEITIAPVVASQQESALQRLLSSALAESGFTVTDKSSARYLLEADLQLDPPIRQQGWTWLRGTLEIKLTTPQGTPIGLERWPLKQSSTEPARARQRLETDIADRLREKLRHVILGFSSAN